jgi:SAM-dependent methyltransferase
MLKWLPTFSPARKRVDNPPPAPAPRVLTRAQHKKEDASMLAERTIDVLDHYVAPAPSPQNAIDLFRGEWSSRLPASLGGLEAGRALLFEDTRITWFEQEVGGFSGKTVLELGPLEGGHTYMLERGGAEQIIAVEANSRAFLKCLIVKELLGLTRVRFLCGDFLEYLRAPGPEYELCVASGVLYHMREPAELLALLARRCRGHLLLWTHYYDDAVISANPDLVPKFTAHRPTEFEDFSHSLHRYEYQQALGWSGFCGGPAPYSHWMTRVDILRGLDHFGFVDIRINFEAPDHPNGPSFAVVATRR